MLMTISTAKLQESHKVANSSLRAPPPTTLLLDRGEVHMIASLDLRASRVQGLRRILSLSLYGAVAHASLV
jgi:hypothetical protein